MHNEEIDELVIEMIASYGMPVGKEVFETCVWIGRFIQVGNIYQKSNSYIYRKEEKMNLCHSMKAKDSNIRQALIDRFGPVGTKGNPRLVLSDLSQIFGQPMQRGVTYIDKERGLYNG